MDTRPFLPGVPSHRVDKTSAAHRRVRRGHVDGRKAVMSGPRPWHLWMLLLVAAGAAGVYLADRMVMAPGRALQQQLAAREAEIRALTERNQALEAAVRLLRHTERRARLVVLDQGPGTEGHLRTRVRFTELDAQGNSVGEPRELWLDGDEVYVDT